MIARDKQLHIGLGVLALACALLALWISQRFGLGRLDSHLKG